MRNQTFSKPGFGPAVIGWGYRTLSVDRRGRLTIGDPTPEEIAWLVDNGFIPAGQSQEVPDALPVHIASDKRAEEGA